MNCPYCKSHNLSVCYKAEMPNILSACPETILNKVRIFPFEVRLCSDCLLGFNSAKLDDHELKLIYDNYLYISPGQGIGSTKYTKMGEVLKKYFSKKDKLVEIGCSEGYLLSILKREGYENLIGIEPGPQAVKAEESGARIIKSYFDEKTFKDETMDGFFMMHVFEHFSNPFLIIEAIKKQLAPSGKIVIEVPYFSGYHHQHLFFYSVNFLKRLCIDNELKIIHLDIEDSIVRIAVTHANNQEYDAVRVEINAKENLDRVLRYYEKFRDTIIKVNTLLKGKEKVYWWGAGSSSVILLNQIDKGLLKKKGLVIIDGDRNKWGMYVPGLNIEVNPFTILKDNSIDCLVIASSFYNEISDTIKQNNINAKEVHVVV